MSLVPKAITYRSDFDLLSSFLKFFIINLVVKSPFEILIISFFSKKLIIGSCHGCLSFFVSSVILSLMNVNLVDDLKS